ncbi:transporter substrate-binding domain-containing protein, partial [Pseudomonas aeruginosa]|nr:transporter substrate-binding domain-containing protein [Pseudomonas aeruginosa]
QFDYVTARNYTELEAILGSGKALLTPVYTSPPIASPDIKLLPPYLRSAVVVLARPEANAGTQRDKGIHHLQGLEGKRVAMVAGFFLEDTVRREHPRIRLQLYPDLAQALASVAADDSDAFVGNDYAARYANAQQLG